jgi:hypothetical protein
MRCAIDCSLTQVTAFYIQGCFCGYSMSSFFMHVIMGREFIFYDFSSV